MLKMHNYVFFQIKSLQSSFIKLNSVKMLEQIK